MMNTKILPDEDKPLKALPPHKVCYKENSFGEQLATRKLLDPREISVK